MLQVAVDGLSDLLLVDELAVETAGFAVAEDVDEQVGLCIAGSEDAGGEPGDGEARELDGVGDGGALLRGDGRGFDGDGVDCRAFGDGCEVFGEEGFELGGIEVAGDGDAGVVGGVELLVEVADVVDAGGFDVGVGADDGGVVGVLVGEEHVVDLLVGEIVGGAFALAALVADDVALVGELDAVEAFEEEAHAIAFEPEGQVELVAGDGLEVVGAVEVGGAVDVGCACAFEVFEVGFFADVLGAFKHHVLEEVGEAGAAGGASLRGPTWYQRSTATSGRRWSSWVMTTRPLGSVNFSYLSSGTLRGFAAGRVSAAFARGAKVRLRTAAAVRNFVTKCEDVIVFLHEDWRGVQVGFGQKVMRG